MEDEVTDSSAYDKGYIMDVHTDLVIPRFGSCNGHKSQISTECVRLTFINYIYNQKCIEMRTKRMEKRSSVLFAIVVFSAVILILASQHASATDHKVHRKAHTVSSQASAAPDSFHHPTRYAHTLCSFVHILC
jgi:hypothetical protein